MSGVEGWAGGEDFNWDDVPDEAPKTPDEGTYRTKIVEAEALETQNGHPAVKVVLELQAPLAGGELGYVNRKVRDTLALTQNAAFRIKQLSKASGTPPPRGSQADAMRDFAERLLGTEPIIKTRNAPNRDKTAVFANVAAYFTPELADEDAKSAGTTTNVGGAVARPPARRGRAAKAAAEAEKAAN